MNDIRFIQVGSGDRERTIAVRQRDGGGPGLFWLSGFKSVMTGNKAESLDALAARTDRQMTRFDYSGHGESGGEFLDGTISRWLEEALAVFDLTKGEQIIIGSSMGGWLALLLNKALRERGDRRVAGLVLIAPAVDMTEDLMRKNFTPQQMHALHNKGVVPRPTNYDDEDYLITEKLILDGADHLLFGKGSIETGCPVHILEGGLDEAVTPDHALKLVSHLTHDPVRFTLIPDGDHRLSRDQDLERLKQAVLGVAEI